MLIFQDKPESIGELNREVNALCGLIRFARERCYPPALTQHLQALLLDCQTEISRREAAAETTA